MRFLGQTCLLAAFVGTGYAAVACTAGSMTGHRTMRRSGVVIAVASVLALGVALAVLAYGLVAKDFGFAYVSEYSNRVLPWHYSLSSLWVGQAGSLLLWAWLLGVMSLVFRFSSRHEGNPLGETAFGILMGFSCFLTATMVFAADPLAPSLVVPGDGVGLSPILQHPAMLMHPPIVFLGYSAWAIPFALAVAALATGRLDASWTSAARPWALFAWIVLGAGILLGAKWAYEELGWGGYWGWDPVENGSLIPWLIGTASIHTLMAWRYRGILKKSALALALATFGMCNFATFLTRSGIFSSVHAFSHSPIGWLFLGLMAAMALAGCVLIRVRRKSLIPERPFQTMFCRESVVVVASIALVTLAMVTCVGTLSAAISDVIVGRKIVVGTAFYNYALIPIGLLLLLTTGSAPLLRWGGAPTRARTRMLLIAAAAGAIAGTVAFGLGVRHPVSISVGGLTVYCIAALAGAFVLDVRRQASDKIGVAILSTLRRGRRQYAGFVVHLGLFCLAVGVTASSLGSQRQDVSMSQGETVEWAGRRVRLAKIVQRELPGKLIAEAQLDVFRGALTPVVLTPAQHFHLHQSEWTSEVDIHSTWTEDFYTIMHSGESQGRVNMTFIRNPMVRWIWLGGCIMGAGSIAGLLPAKAAARTGPRDWDRRLVPCQETQWEVASTA